MEKMDLYVKTVTILIEKNVIITRSPEMIMIKRNEKLLTL